MKIGESFNQSPYQAFVNPILCNRLRMAGMTLRTMYVWKVRGQIADLDTFFFDKDDYYGAAASMVHAVNQPTIIPAYDITDMYKALPGQYNRLEHAFGMYTLTMSKEYHLQPVTGSRLPDVLAEMVLQCVEAGYMNMGVTNKKIEAFAG